MVERRRVIDRVEDIPDDMSEEEEDRFWSEHQLGEALLDQMRPLHEGAVEAPEAGTAEPR